MNTQFRKGILEVVILSEIKRKDYYGYELVKAISEHIDVSESTVYPILRRLTKDENLSTYLEKSSDGPPRKYFKITNQGIGRLQDLTEEWQEFSKIVEQFLERGAKDA